MSRLDADGHVTAEGRLELIAEEVEFLLAHKDEPAITQAIAQAIADPSDRWHDELVKREAANA